MQRQLAFRLIGGLVAIAVMIVGWRWFKEFTTDPDFGDYNSAGQILALEVTDEGQRAVLLDESGNATYPPSPEATFEDSDVSWSHDGQRVFISSTRESSSYNIYRWNPAKNRVDRRSEGTRSQTAPWFGPYTNLDGFPVGLSVVGGVVMEFDPRSGATRQVLPPGRDRAVAQEGEGAVSNLEAIYGRIGEGFIEARYLGDQSVVAATMRSGQGEVLIVHDLRADENGRIRPPMEIARGRQVSFGQGDDGVLAVSLRGFQFPPDQPVPDQFIVDGKAVPPFDNAIIRVELRDGQLDQRLVFSSKGDQAVGQIAVSADSTTAAVVFGTSDDEGGFTSQGILLMPLLEGGAQGARPLVQGSVSAPTWSPDGLKIAFLRLSEGSSTIHVVNANGSGEKQVSKEGRFSQPQFSPQTAAK